MRERPMTGLALRDALSEAMGIPADGLTAALGMIGSSWQRVAETAHELASYYDDDAHAHVYVGVTAGYVAAAVHAMPRNDASEATR